MRKFKIELSWAGLSEGNATYIVEADNKAQAVDNYFEGDQIDHNIITNDIEGTITSVEELH